MKIELNRASEDFSEKRILKEDADTLNLQADGAAFQNPVKVELTITKNQSQLICRGRIEAPVVLECSRCLKEYPQSLLPDIAFVVDLGGTPNHEKSEEEGYFLADPASAHFVIDELVREAVLLSLPLKPLCSEGCLGLCPVCGTDLNRSRCGCKRETPDPRWDQLKSLLKNESQA
jgi:uncharacterized protein